MIPTNFVLQQNTVSVVDGNKPLGLQQATTALVKQVLGKKDAFESTHQTPQPKASSVGGGAKKQATQWLPWALLGGGLATAGVVLAVYHNKAQGRLEKIIPTMQEDLGKVFGNKTKQQTEELVESAVTPDEILSSSPPVKEIPDSLNPVDVPTSENPIAQTPQVLAKKLPKKQTLRQRIGTFLGTIVLIPSFGLPTIAVDHAFNQSRIRQCLAEGTEQLVKSPVRSVEIKPVVGGKAKPQLVKNSTQLLPPLQFTKTDFQAYDPQSLKTYTLIDRQGKTIQKELYKAIGVSDKYFDKQGVEY
jgi:hypothetical protein